MYIFSLSLDNNYNYTKWCPTRKPENGQFCERPSKWTKWKCYYGKSCQDERNKKCNRKTECVCEKGKFECTSSTTCHKCTKIWKECPDFKPSKLDKCDLGGKFGKCDYAQFESHRPKTHTCVCDDKFKKKFKCKKEKQIIIDAGPNATVNYTLDDALDDLVAPPLKKMKSVTMPRGTDYSVASNTVPVTNIDATISLNASSLEFDNTSGNDADNDSQESADDTGM